MNPLYITGINPEGKPLMGGVFRMKDEHGFPLDCSRDVLKEKGWEIDYLELLCDAWLHDVDGFDSVCRELDMLDGSHVQQWKLYGAVFLKQHPRAIQRTDSVDVFCRYVMAKKRMKLSNTPEGEVDEDDDGGDD